MEETKLNPQKVRDALNNSGLPQIAMKIWNEADIKAITENDKNLIKQRIKENDSYYKSGWKCCETRLVLTKLLGE